ncbi:hypothetical protein HDZ31DRAFT_32183, partial [Schizophyllum fasciatum]
NSQNAQKQACRSAISVIESKTIYFDWGVSWAVVHGATTSQLGGLKPGCRKDSKGSSYHVGLFNSRNKQIIPPPLVEAAFDHSPTTKEVCDALRAAVDAS